MQLAATADLELGEKVTAPKFALTKLDVDLPRAQDELRRCSRRWRSNPYVDKNASPTTAPSVMTQLAQRLLSITSGRLTGSAAGSYDGTTLTLSQPLVLSMQKVTLDKTEDGREARARERDL